MSGWCILRGWSLTILGLFDIKVANAGTVNLKELKSLQEQYFYRTQVTDGGVKDLQVALPKCEIFK